MSNKKKAKHQSKKSSVAKNIAGGAVGTIFNVVLIIVAVMLIYYLAVSAYQYGVRIYGEPAISEEPGTEINVTIKGLRSSSTKRAWSGKRDCFIFRSAYPTIQRTALWRATMCFPLR